MRQSGITKKFLIVLTLTLIFTFLLLHKNTSAINVLRGYVNLSEISAQDRYFSTKLRHFESESSWLPSKNIDISSQPDINGKIGILVDIKTGTVLYEKNSKQQKEIASLVKIMTAVVALEHSDLNELIYVSQQAESIGENTMGVSSGETYTLKELLYGLVLYSGNDAAYAIAEGVGGDVPTFVEWMNIKADELGMLNTHFADPSGLDDSTYSSAVDLVKLTRYALQYPDFREVAATMETELISDTHKYLPLYNQTNLLSTYPGVAGVKTGYTEVAGLCLVTYANNEGHEVVGIVLDSLDRKGDMILMLDYGFSLLGVTIEHNLL